MSTTTIVIAAVAFLVLVTLIVAAASMGAKKPDDEFGRFSRKDLLNKSEKRLFADLRGVIPEVFGPDAYILSQVSYGEFLKGEDQSAHARINQKRADFVVVGVDLQVLCVIEYQGSGHYGRGEKSRENAEYRDRVKRAACASAGIPFAEVPAKFSKASLTEILAGVATVDGASLKTQEAAQ